MSRGTAGIVEQLLEARRARGISQRELSKRSGLTQAQISRIENGIVDLRISTLLALADQLDLRFSLQPRTRHKTPPGPGSPKTPRPTPSTESATHRPGIFGDLAEELL